MPPSRFTTSNPWPFRYDAADLLRNVKEKKLPLHTTWSKSKGIHLWLFADNVPAKAMIDTLEWCRDQLGLPEATEIFPKQHQIGPEDTGNWINLPFFGDQRRGITCDDDGKLVELSLDEFIESAEPLTLKQMNRLHGRQEERRISLVDTTYMLDGPYCLGQLFETGVGDGHRNIVALEAAIYCKLKYGDEEGFGELHEINNEFLDPRLSDGELQRIWNSALKKDYKFGCRKTPMKDRCNREECLTRDFGMGYWAKQGDGSHLEPIYLEGGQFIEDLNQTYFVTNRGGKTVVVEKSFDDILERSMYRFSSFDAFAQYHDTKKIEYYPTPWSDRTKIGTQGRLWLTSSKRRTFRQMVFDPTKPPGHCGPSFNMWEGFAVQPIPGDWTKLGDHIHRIICAGDQAVERMVLDLLAYWVQYPERQGEVSLALRGEQGTGKGVFANAVLRLWGPHGLYLSHHKHLTGNFNGHLLNVCCLFADEAVFAGDHRAVNQMKALVTEPLIGIEDKYLPMINVPNRLKIIMASNNPQIVSAGRDERRYQILEVSEDRKQHREYFGAIVDELSSGGLAAFLHDLLNREIGDQPPTVVRGEGMQMQQQQSLEPVAAYWVECLQAGIFLNAGEWAPEIRRNLDLYISKDAVTSTRLHDGFKDWCKSEGIRVPRGGVVHFSRELNKMLMENKPDRAHGNMRQFPSLVRCREWFVEYMGWDADTYEWEPEPLGESPAARASGDHGVF